MDTRSIDSRFSFRLAYLHSTNTNWQWRNVDSFVCVEDVILSMGVQGAENLFDFEFPNITITLFGDHTLADSDGFSLQPYSMAEIWLNIGGQGRTQKLYGYVNPDGLRVVEDLEGWVKTEVLITSYFSFFKEMYLGTVDYDARAMESPESVEEVFCLYIKEMDVPRQGGMGSPNESDLVRAEIALMPSTYHRALHGWSPYTQPSLLPGDEIAFKRRFIYDSRVLGGCLSQHIDPLFRSQLGWSQYVYNDRVTAYIRYLEPDQINSVPLYNLPAVSLHDVVADICDTAGRYFLGFMGFKGQWPSFVFQNTQLDFPTVQVPGEVELTDVGIIYHFRLIEIDSNGDGVLDQAYLLVWHSQWDLEIFSVVNGTILSSLGTYQLGGFTEPYVTGDPWSGRNFSIHDLFHGLYWHTPLSTIAPEQNERALLHRDIGEWTNCNYVENNRYIYIIWFKAAGYVYTFGQDERYQATILYPNDPNDLPDPACFSRYIEFHGIRFDVVTQNIDILYPQTTRVQPDLFYSRYTDRNEYFNIPPTWWAWHSEGFNLTTEHTFANLFGDRWHVEGGEGGRGGQGYVDGRPGPTWADLLPFAVNDGYWTFPIPKNRIGEEWTYENEQWNNDDEPQVGQLGIELWVDGWVNFWNNRGLYIESTPSIQQSQILNGSYIRRGFRLYFNGDIAVDKISFSFENAKAADVLKTICMLTDSRPVFSLVGPNQVGIKFVSRDAPESGSIYGYHNSDVIIKETQSFRYINREKMPDFQPEGLELSDLHAEILNRYYQKKYFQNPFNLYTVNFAVFDNNSPPWVSTIEIGDNLIGLGKVDSLKFGLYNLEITLRD